jgi:hypothetical protein
MDVVKMAGTFTNEEYADMHFVCGVCNGNGKALWWNTGNISTLQNFTSQSI